MREEIKVFLTTILFYTRIPCPKWVDHSPDYIDRSIRYFPLVGWIVGAVSGLGLLGGTLLVGPLFGAVLFLSISVLLTGAFHEDGFADVCDGFGGGWSKEQILNIMKDSRVGTYAVAGLILLILGKLSLIIELSQTGHVTLLLIVINGHTLSRLMAATVIFTHSYARDDASSKIKPVAKSFSIANVLVATLFGLLPLLAIIIVSRQPLWLIALIPLYFIKMCLARYFKKGIGGYTGDCLGAVQQVTEVTFYLTAVVLWKYIS